MMSEKQVKKFHIDEVSLGSGSNQSGALPRPDLGSDMPSVWSSCARFSDVILWGNHYCCHKMLVLAIIHIGIMMYLLRFTRQICSWFLTN